MLQQAVEIDRRNGNALIFFSVSNQKRKRIENANGREGAEEIRGGGGDEAREEKNKRRWCEEC